METDNEGVRKVAAEEAEDEPASVPQSVEYVSFSAEIIPKTTEALLGVCAQLVNKGTDEIYLLLSSPGGSVMHGLTIYNILRGLPCTITTHNVGNVDSIGNMVFLAGERRYAAPHATFMFHGVGIDVQAKTRLEEKLLRERLGSLQSDQKRIGSVIVDRTSISEEEVDELFLEAMTRNPDYALERGIIHEIRDVEIPRGATITQLVFQR